MPAIVVAPFTAIPLTVANVSGPAAVAVSLESRLPDAVCGPAAETEALSGSATGVDPVTLTVSVLLGGVCSVTPSEIA